MSDNRNNVSDADYRRIMATLIQRAMLHLPSSDIDRLTALKRRRREFADA